MTSEDLATSRRNFVAQLGIGSVALAASACTRTTPPVTAVAPSLKVSVPDARPGSNVPAIAIPPTADDGPWDMTWLKRSAAAKHALVFDIGAYQNGGGLYYAKNYLNGMRDGWGLSAPKVLPLLGISGDAYPLVFNDAVWAKFGYGASSKTTDARTGQLAVRNVFWQPRDGESMFEFGADVLQQRGAQFLLCNNVFRGVIRRAMAQTHGSYADVRRELTAGLLPGVIVVPAMVAAMAMAQSRGAAYVYAGA